MSVERVELRLPVPPVLHPADVIVVEVSAESGGGSDAGPWPASPLTVLRGSDVLSGGLRLEGLTVAAVRRGRYRVFTSEMTADAFWVAPIPIRLTVPRHGQQQVRVSPLVVATVEAHTGGMRVGLQVSLATLDEWVAVFESSDGEALAVLAHGGDAHLSLTVNQFDVSGVVTLLAPGPWYLCSTARATPPCVG